MRPPTFKTSRLTLKAYRPEDEDTYIEMILDPISLQFMGGNTGNELEERQLFNKIFALYAQDETRWFWIFGIYLENRLCGHLEIKETEHTQADELEIVYMIHPATRRKGIMTEVLALLKTQQHIWKRRIIATLSPENTHSMALLQKWGIDKQEELGTKDVYWKVTLNNSYLS